MAKFESDIEGLTQYSVQGKKVKANKDGVFELTLAQENAIRAAGYVLVPVAPVVEPEKVTTAPTGKKGAQPPAAPTMTPAERLNAAIWAEMIKTPEQDKPRKNTPEELAAARAALLAAGDKEAAEASDPEA